MAQAAKANDKLAAKSIRRVAPKPPLKINFLVRDVARMYRTLFDQKVKVLGITRAQWLALSALSRHELKGTIQSDLARELEVGKVTIGQDISTLIMKNIAIDQIHLADEVSHEMQVNLPDALKAE
jgi:DNA-binding MarR family transcriptional regulator